MNNMLNIIIDKKKYTNKQEATKGIPERSNKMVNSDPEFVTIQNFFSIGDYRTYISSILT
ncbi:hypothetical protein [Paenilisteria weihenstephanensis]|uniref:hypothetical protein n=1 Tax=Listeria weihenstephanensis TaxID=1006155 RepID=UPI000564D01B|nr:hypothetical protein [Listeria weihenstephanensis]